MMGATVPKLDVGASVALRVAFVPANEPDPVPVALAVAEVLPPEPLGFDEEPSLTILMLSQLPVLSLYSYYGLSRVISVMRSVLGNMCLLDLLSFWSWSHRIESILPAIVDALTPQLFVTLFLISEVWRTSTLLRSMAVCRSGA